MKTHLLHLQLYVRAEPSREQRHAQLLRIQQLLLPRHATRLLAQAAYMGLVNQ